LVKAVKGAKLLEIFHFAQGERFPISLKKLSCSHNYLMSRPPKIVVELKVLDELGGA